MAFPAQLLDQLTVSFLYEARPHNYQGILESIQCRAGAKGERVLRLLYAKFSLFQQIRIFLARGQYFGLKSPVLKFTEAAGL